MGCVRPSVEAYTVKKVCDYFAHFFRQVPNGDWISDHRTGLTFNDCTSAAFAMDIPWNKVLNTFTPCTWVVLNYSPSLVVPARLAATTQGYY